MTEVRSANVWPPSDGFGSLSLASGRLDLYHLKVRSLSRASVLSSDSRACGSQRVENIIFISRLCGRRHQRYDKNSLDNSMKFDSIPGGEQRGPPSYL